MEPTRLPPLPTPPPLATWVYGFGAMWMLLAAAFATTMVFGVPAAMLIGAESWRSGLGILATIVAAWVFQMVFAVFDQDRSLFTRHHEQVVDRGLHGGQHWYELTGGVRVAAQPPAPVFDPDPRLTASGFELTVPNRRSTVRTVTRLLSATAAATLMLLTIGWVVTGLARQDLLLSFGAWALLVLPGAGLAAVRSHRRDQRRAREWTERIRLDGALLTTDVGRITLQPGFTVERFEDAAGNGLVVRSGGETLRFRAAWSALEWVEPRLQQARLAEGSAEEVPEALHRGREAAVRRPRGLRPE